MLWILLWKNSGITCTYTWFHVGWEYWKPPWTFEKGNWDLPGGPVAKTPCSQCKGPGLIPAQGTRSHMLQAREYIPKLKRLRVTTTRVTTRHGQINIYMYFLNKGNGKSKRSRWAKEQKQHFQRSLRACKGLFRVKWRKALGSGNSKQVCTQVNIWILKEISPGCSLEGMMLKLKL